MVITDTALGHTHKLSHGEREYHRNAHAKSGTPQGTKKTPNPTQGGAQPGRLSGVKLLGPEGAIQYPPSFSPEEGAFLLNLEPQSRN